MAQALAKQRRNLLKLLEFTAGVQHLSQYGASFATGLTRWTQWRVPRAGVGGFMSSTRAPGIRHERFTDFEAFESPFEEGDPQEDTRFPMKPATRSRTTSSPPRVLIPHTR